jgi:histone H3/H4
MPSTMKRMPEPSRKSERAAKAPARFRPGNSDCPTELLSLIHEVATSAADKSEVPFEAGAVVALEEALEPMLEAMCAQAYKIAEADGRDEITEQDLRAVSKSFMKKA